MKADMRGASICGAKLAFARLDGADLRAATVAYKGPAVAKEAEGTFRVDFSNASLKGASFSHARLEGVNFNGAILEGANFKNARLANVSFRNAVLTGVNIADMGLPPESFEGAIRGIGDEALARKHIIAAKLEAHALCIASAAARGAPQCLTTRICGRCTIFWLARA